MKVFISYSRHDEAAVRSLAGDLERARVQVWLDEDLGGGEAWWSAILKQIRDSTVFVFALSDNSLRSTPCRAELDYAEVLGLPILPVQIGHVSTYRTDEIFTRQVVDYRESTRESGIALVAALHEQAAGRAELPDPLPEPPKIPYEYLVRLGSAIRDSGDLPPSEQASMFYELRAALDEEDEASVSDDIRDLLRSLRSRRDVTYGIARDISAILNDSCDAKVSSHARPGTVTAAAVIAFVYAAVFLLDAIGGAFGGVAGLPPGLKYLEMVRDLAVAPLLVWGGIAAMRGTTKKVLLLSLWGTAIAWFVWDAFVLIPSPSTAKYILTVTIVQLIILVPINLLLRTRSSRDFFNARGAPAPEPTLVEDATSSTAASEPTVASTVPSRPLQLTRRQWFSWAPWYLRRPPSAPAKPAMSLGLRKATGYSALAALVLTAVAASVIAAIVRHRSSQPSQVELPFAGLNRPEGVAVDTAGDVYIADAGNYRVLKLPAGSNTQVVLPFTGIHHHPAGVAVSTAGDVYVTSAGKIPVVKLPAGSNTQVELPFTGLNTACGVAVDTAGDVYVVDNSNNRVFKLRAGSNTQVELPFTGLDHPCGVAVDTAGDVYVTDAGNNRVLKLPAGSNTQVELPGLDDPWGVAVDTAGDVYVTNASNGPVLKLPAGSNTQVELPFTGLNRRGVPSTDWGNTVAVDTAGNVYITDYGNNRVLKLPAH